MDDGREVIAKVPNPNAGSRHFTTASEVATMDFARKVLHIPAPKVHTWSSSASANTVNAEYIIMEKIPGVELENVWEELTGRQRFEVVQQVVGFEASFASTRFSSFGSLYYAHDISKASQREDLYVNEEGTEVPHSRFAVGPTTSRMFFDDGRAAVDVDRGPWRNLEDYVVATAGREIACINRLPSFPRPQGLFYGPRQYSPTKNSKLSTLSNYLKVATHLLPRKHSFRASIMWHGDLHRNNIFVHPERPTEIVGVIDWQCVHLSPLFLQVRHPSIIEFDGPVPEGFDPIELPDNFNNISPEEQKVAKALRSAQTIYKLYEVELRQRNEDLFRALQYRNTLPCKVTGLAGSLFRDGEPIVTGLLMAVEAEWPKIVGTDADGRPAVPCPLSFSSQEKDLQSADEAKWIEGIELMEAALDDLGAPRGWDGWVSHADYELMKVKLRDCLQRFLDREARDDRERAEWIKAWPFADS
ncbi:MAG: hypothetical protein M1817_003346 [Caeruleum heppii]|nr:MAG: hypothetical protein M1817_003346 [Caeruleum heppii]